MNEQQIEALLEFLRVVVRFMQHHGGLVEQPEIIESWQTLNERMVGDPE